MPWLLDTDIAIEYLRFRLPENASLRLATAIAIKDAGTSIVNVAELRLGVARANQSPDHLQVSRLAEFLSDLVILPLDDPATREYAAIRSQLQRAGAAIGAMDALIAAIALANDATLVTNNVREFSRVPGLRIENWLRAS